MIIYTVMSGDSIDTISSKFQVSASSIIYLNQIPYPYPLAIGQALLIPTEDENLLNTDENSNIIILRNENRFLYTGGYAYPFIQNWVLNQSLPNLSYLYVFSYGFTIEGDLIPPPIDDSSMIAKAKQYNTAPILTLTPFDETGQFNNYLISRVINDLTARANLKNQIITTILTKGFQGLDIDFEFILASDRDAFVDFVSYMKESVGALGYPVSVALAPKTSDTQTGLLYEGKDYQRLGAVADYVLLMTYEWGYTYGPPMAVAPLNKVREVVEYAVTVIPPEKIHLGIANYGYDWTLPYIRGLSKAVTIGNIEAVQIAIQNDVAIQFDELAQSPFFNYQEYSIERDQYLEHQVWFEDARSINGKMDLIKEFGLRGISCWQIMELFRGLFITISSRFNILK